MHLGLLNVRHAAWGTLFGDGTYSGNIIQGGSVLQPQASYTVYTPVSLSGAVASAEGYSAGYEPGLAIDGNTATIWHWYGMMAAWWAITFPSAFVLNKYTLYGYSDRVGPTAWTLYGSNDGGTSWTTIESRSGQNLSTEQSFITSGNTTAYSSYKYAFSGGTYTGVVLAEARFYIGTALNDAIVVTGAATVAPDATTLASAFSCKNLVIDGSGASLKASTNSKGLLGFVSGKVFAINSATATMTGLGYAGNFGDINPYDLVPAAIRSKLSKSKLAAFTVKGEGAAGAAAIAFTGTAQVDGATGAASMLSLQTGGGGGGGARLGPLSGSSSKGGKGGPCCSGGGGGGLISVTAGVVASTTPDYGQGGAGVLDAADMAYRAEGGAGSPPGASVGNGSPNAVAGYGAGLLMFFAPQAYIGSGSLICSDGSAGAGSNVSGSSGSGSSGGGIAAIITTSGGFTNNGTLRAAGGALPVAASYGRGGAGGTGYAGNLTVA